MNLQLSILTIFALSLVYHATASKITVTNRCNPIKIWIGIQGAPRLSTTGFELAVGETKTLDVPRPWVSGRIWARTHCQRENGRFACKTGDCGQTDIPCNGAGGVRPATLAEFTLAPVNGQDFYDISNVDGSNLPISITPTGGTGETCKKISCTAAINRFCPPELSVKDYGYTIGCKSPCAAFGGALACCEGPHDKPESCPGTKQAYEVFKKGCPQAYSYPYDDQTSTFTCWGNTDYDIVFCP